MCVPTSDIIRIIESFAPLGEAYEWDNSGLVINAAKETNGVLIALDATEAAVDQAVREDCSLILSHHPLMFHPINKLDCTSGEGKVIAELIKNNISLYCAHTSCDRAQGGINDMLCRLLGLSGVDKIYDQDGRSCARIGSLKNAMSADELAGYIKQKLDLEMLRVTGNNNSISRICVCGGAGGSYLKQAREAGADAMLTGEAHYNDHIAALSGGTAIFEAGHAETEQVFIREMSRCLQSAINDVKYNIRLVEAEVVRPYRYY